MAKHNILHGQLTKTSESKLVPCSEHTIKYREFVDSLDVGQTIDVFMESNLADGTLTQLARAHAMLREIAKYTGNSYAEEKFELKKRCGLCFFTMYKGERVLTCKSLGDCSKEQLGKVIEELYIIGEFLGVVFKK